MKTVYTAGMVLVLSGLAFAGSPETKIMKEMAKDAIMKDVVPVAPAVPAAPAIPGMGKSMDAAKDAIKKEVAPHIMPPGMEMDDPSDGMSEADLLIADDDMSPDEMDEEANLLIAEGQALKKRAAEMRAKGKMPKSGAMMPGGAPKK